MMLYIRGRYKETHLSCDREVLDYAHSKNMVWEEAICFACATTRFWPKRWNSGGGGYSYKRKDQEAGALARDARGPTTHNIKSMAGSIRNFTIDFPHTKFGFKDTRFKYPVRLGFFN